MPAGNDPTAQDGASPNGSGPVRTTPTVPSSPAAIEEEIRARRERLAATIDELTVRAQPKEIARRGAEDLRAKAGSAVRTPDGALRTERIVSVAGAALVVLVVVVAIRRRR